MSETKTKDETPSPAVGMIEFFVPGPPVAQQRAKTKIKKIIGGGVKIIGKYDPQKCVDFKNHVADLAFAAVRESFASDVAIGLEMVFYLPRPPSISIKKRLFPVKKPDWDNLGKGPSDAMESIVYYKDSQVVDCRVRKFYADNGQPVGAQVKVWQIKTPTEAGVS